MKYYDIIIVGGGPSGSTAALALANSGLAVAVIEKESFPRNKVCGDAVAAYVPKILHSINPAYAKALLRFTEKTSVNTCRIIAPNRQFIDVKSVEKGFISKRLNLDHFLYELASKSSNLDWLLNHEVKDVTIDTEKQLVTVVTGKDTFTCKLIIGCDGAHSVVNRKITSNKTDLQHYSAAVRAYYKNVTGFTHHTYELHFLKQVLPGYFWIFPLPDNTANVGLCIPSETVSKQRINLRDTMEQIIQQEPGIRERFIHASIDGKTEGYGLPLGARKLQVSGDHFMICGDAASLIDPATGEGIGQAIISGRYAAWQAMKCFKEKCFDAHFMKQYEETLYSKLWRDARISYRIQQQFFSRPSLFNTTFSFLNKFPILRNAITRQVAKVS